jgi:1-deoxy-D-xylulose-5-phosphate reductoisomerase
VNAADEVAVEAFLAGRLPFTGIAPLIEDAVARWGDDAAPGLPDLIALDAEVRAALASRIGIGGGA